MIPAVSVLLPFRDVASTIEEALQSVLAERDVPLEVLAIDDGSTDGSVERVAAIADDRVRLLRAGGGGLVAALELGRDAARAPMLMRMDGDDVSLPGRAMAQLAALETHDLAVVGGLVEAFGEGVGEGLARYVAWQNALRTPEDHARDAFVEATLCHPSVMLRASALDRVGGWRSGPFAEDWDLWLRMDAAGLGAAKIDRPVLRWRHRAGRATFADARYGMDAHRRLRALHLAPFLRRAAADRPLVCWGAGPIARRTARELETHGVRFTRFLEIDPRRVGGTCRGAPIDAVPTLRAEDFVVTLVGARGARDLIRTELLAAGRRDRIDFVCAA